MMTEEQREQVREYQKRVTQIAQNALTTQAAPTGDRPDLWDDLEKPIEERSGDSYESTGPTAQQWQAPKNGTLVWGPGFVGRVVPNPVEAKPAEPRPMAQTVATPVQGHLRGTSAIGAKTLAGAAAPCGPPGVPWKPR